MQSPRQSFGESMTQPSTPSSASIECGGRRSTEDAARASVADFLRRPFRKSADDAPASGFTESSMPQHCKLFTKCQYGVTTLFTFIHRQARIHHCQPSPCWWGVRCSHYVLGLLERC